MARSLNWVDLRRRRSRRSGHSGDGLDGAAAASGRALLGGGEEVVEEAVGSDRDTDGGHDRVSTEFVGIVVQVGKLECCGSVGLGLRSQAWMRWRS